MKGEILLFLVMLIWVTPVLKVTDIRLIVLIRVTFYAIFSPRFRLLLLARVQRVFYGTSKYLSPGSYKICRSTYLKYFWDILARF